MRYLIPLLLFLFTGILLINACRSSEEKEAPAKQKPKLPPPGTISALPLEYTSPANNPSTPEKIELGRLLFYDPVLSGGKDVACASCHHPEFGYAESLELPVGVNGRGLGERRSFNKNNDIPFTKRNAPSLLNVAFNGIDENGKYIPEEAPMFWDMRAKSLEQQAMMPVSTFEEMRGHGFTENNIKEEVSRRISNIPLYRKLFKEAFPDAPAITDTLISRALAAFQRSLIANNSRFDRYMRGEKTALSSREINGMNLFIKTGCARCHNGPMLSDYKPHVLGVVDNEKLPFSDSGYHKTYAFRTPTLRNLRFTRPYMHNGKIATLDNVMFFYEDLKGKPLPNPHVHKEQLDSLAVIMTVEFKDLDNIVEFLNTLNDDQYDKKIPASVPSGLPVGGNIKN